LFCFVELSQLSLSSIPFLYKMENQPSKPAPTPSSGVPCLVMRFKRERGSRTLFDEFEIVPGRPVYVGREKLRALITGAHPDARFWSPAEKELQALLSSRHAHCVIEYLEASDPRVTKAGFYIRIIPKKDGSAPTNPLWMQGRTEPATATTPASTQWHKLAFSPEPMLLQAPQNYCLGGEVHFTACEIVTHDA